MLIYKYIYFFVFKIERLFYYQFPLSGVEYYINTKNKSAAGWTKRVWEKDKNELCVCVFVFGQYLQEIKFLLMEFQNSKNPMELKNSKMNLFSSREVY